MNEREAMQLVWAQARRRAALTRLDAMKQDADSLIHLYKDVPGDRAGAYLKAISNHIYLAMSNIKRDLEEHS